MLTSGQVDLISSNKSTLMVSHQGPAADPARFAVRCVELSLSSSSSASPSATRWTMPWSREFQHV